MAITPFVSGFSSNPSIISDILSSKTSAGVRSYSWIWSGSESGSISPLPPDIAKFKTSYIPSHKVKNVGLVDMISFSRVPVPGFTANLS
ncbi:hypothetical protein ES705_48224 [subsurface metagenome]